jgi:general secretion pathway protein K
VKHLARPWVAQARGLALVATLWMTAALMVTATGVVYLVRNEVRAATALREAAAAGALGDAGIMLAARQIAGARTADGLSRRQEFEFEQARIVVRVVPLSGLVDLNSAGEPLLTDLIAVGGGVDRSRAATLAQRIIDWRDPDTQPQPDGAEDAAYAAAGSPFRTRGGPFEAPEDLLQVLGIDFDLYDRLRRLITVHVRGVGQVDPAAAPPAVLLVLAAGNEQIASAYLAAREASGPLADSTRFPAAYVGRAVPSRYLFQAAVPLSNGAVFVSRRVLDLGVPTDGLPWTVVWGERVIEPADAN